MISDLLSFCSSKNVRYMCENPVSKLRNSDDIVENVVRLGL